MITSLIAVVAATLTGQSPNTSTISLSLSPKEPFNEDSYLAAIRDVTRSGSNGTVISIKWADGEQGTVMSEKLIRDQLNVAKFCGGETFVGIHAVDTNNKSVPAELARLKWDDPNLIQRWEKFLEFVVPMLPKNIKGIAFGNEVDVYFKAHRDEWPSYERLMLSARAFIKGAGIKGQVGVITTFDGLKRSPELIAMIQKPWSATMMTYYPVSESFSVLPIQDVPMHFDAMLEMSAGKPLFLTEIGCPASTACKSSESLQAQFVTAAFAQIRKNESKIAWGNYFMLHDFAPLQLDMFETYYRLKDESFRGYLGSLGLKQINDTPRASWKEFQKQMRQWNDDHGNL